MNYYDLVRVFSDSDNVLDVINKDKKLTEMYRELFFEVRKSRKQFGLRNLRAPPEQFVLVPLSAAVIVRLDTLAKQLRTRHKIELHLRIPRIVKS